MASKLSTVGSTTSGKDVVLPSVNPNAGLQVLMHRKLLALVEQMHKSLLYWIRAAYNANPPEAMAIDASPAMALRQIMRSLARRWQKRFNEAAPELADYFSKAMAERSDKALEAILRKAGITVRFRMTKSMNDVMQATIGEQVGLIKSIAQQHLTQVEGMVMRSIQKGGNMGELTKQLEKAYGISTRRAVLISRDQNNKATATMNKTRQIELGITKARWMHSHAGKIPRKSHLANNGKEYDIAKGWYDPDAKKVCWPGTLINCRCKSRSIIPGIGK